MKSGFSLWTKVEHNNYLHHKHISDRNRHAVGLDTLFGLPSIVGTISLIDGCAMEIRIRLARAPICIASILKTKWIIKRITYNVFHGKNFTKNLGHLAKWIRKPPVTAARVFRETVTISE
jgi:hypothetical protein